MDKAAAEMLGEAVVVSCPAIPTGLGIISRVGKLLVEFPRADLQAVTFQPSGMGASDLTFELRDSKRLETQVARVHRGKAEKVAAALGADAPSDN